MEKKRTRRFLLLGAGAAVGLFLLYAFWPRPLLVDLAEARREPMIVTIDEEARTRVRDEYIVSAPITGRLLRVDVEPGDHVERQNTILARIAASDPAFLDERTRAEAEASVRAAEAALGLAEADLRRTKAEEAYAETEAGRARELARTNIVSEAAVDRAELSLRTARANRATAEAAVRMRVAELENAHARLLPPAEDAGLTDGPSARPGNSSALMIRSPLSGSVLRVLQESEMVIAAGSPIVSIGDPANDLEILTELLSTDAVQVRPGARVIIEDWGGPEALEGVVKRVEPYGFTKISALGVEEQRVNVIIDFRTPHEARAGLAHGFRVNVRIIVWEDNAALVIPSSALFRHNAEWAAFIVEGRRARQRPLKVGRNNGVQAQILDGLAEGAVVVEYPGDRLKNKIQVARRTTGH